MYLNFSDSRRTGVVSHKDLEELKQSLYIGLYATPHIGRTSPKSTLISIPIPIKLIISPLNVLTTTKTILPLPLILVFVQNYIPFDHHSA